MPDEILQLTNLKKFSLSSNQLTSLPAEIRQLTNLQTLSLSGNQLTSLPAEIRQLTNLQTLDLASNQLASLPAEIRQLTNLKKLSLSSNQLASLPAEIGQLTNLQELSLFDNQLASLPAEIGQLTHLQRLYLYHNQLVSLPAEIGQLSNLQKLSLFDNQLTSLPDEILQLTNLHTLNLTSNQLTSLPAEIGQLTDLKKLSLSGNQLTSLPDEILQLTNLKRLSLSSNQLTSLPAEIRQLTNLKTLNLTINQLTSLPAEIGQLTNLQELSLFDNQLTSLPAEIGQLTNLQSLSLSGNQLTSLPAEIGQLTNLQTLSLSSNQLTSLPAEIRQLTNLQTLSLSGNQLTSLSAEIGQLTNLKTLYLHRNQLASLPAEIGQLTNLQELSLFDNQLTSLPNEVIDQGIEAILAYLREQLEGESKQWISKLIVVGEGGVGKTQMLRVLRGDGFDASVSTTHGIEIEMLDLKHPEYPDITMHLNTWDFGGQEIYHATHKFFLTNRSLFLVVWNARYGFEQGKLYYWLDTIKANAPDSPVLLVATQIDERDPDIPISDLMQKYPRIIGQCAISNTKIIGIDELRNKLEHAAADLPLMGEVWPTNWLNAANAIRSKTEKSISSQQLLDIMAEHDVTGESAKVLSKWLHELGDILYFQDNVDLKDVVILNPQWVTASISRVLESDDVIDGLGIFTRSHMNDLWADIDPSMREHFLQLMEQFDLSYKIPYDGENKSLIVERLSFSQADYEKTWEAAREKEACKEISMRFLLDTTMPSGIPTYFIARQHRFTTNTHWRYGALLADGNHLGLVRAFPHDRYVELSVRGSYPPNFFALLRDGLELTLARFPGIKITRLIPCPGHSDKPCSYEFTLDYIEKTIEKCKETVECQNTLEDVPLVEILTGFNGTISPSDKMLQHVESMCEFMITQHNEQSSEHKEQIELMQREFTAIFRRKKAELEAYCPAVFTLHPEASSEWKEKFAGQKMKLQLYCEAPGCWHSAGESGCYTINKPAKWLKAVGPYIRTLVKVMKCAAPFVAPGAGIALPDFDEKEYKNQFTMMEKLVEKMPGLEDVSDLADTFEDDISNPQNVSGSSLRSIKRLLDELDPKQVWGGLRKVITPEGHHLWLCEEHAKEYLR